MNRHLTIATIAFALLASSCAEPTSLGPSDLAQILSFQIAGQSGITTIDHEARTVHLTVPDDYDLSSVTPQSVSLSTFAILQPDPTTSVDLRTPFTYTVRAESGRSVVYTVIAERADPEAQLENTDLDGWHSVGQYLEPGATPTTIWATGNAGVVTLSTANVVPFEVAPGDTGVSLTTRDLGSLGQLVGQRMGSGSFFTGTFKLNIRDPLASAQFGVPFTSMPSSWKVDLAYQAGTPYLSGKGQTITDRVDSADIYLLLEDRTTEPWKRVATGWLRLGNDIIDLTTFTIPIVYGPLPANTPAYMLPRQGQTYAAAGTRPTHISVVFASSCRGDQFEGGTNSTLKVNSIRLDYGD